MNAHPTKLGGRYELVERAAGGGMAVVWRGLTVGAAGFVRPVAVKRLLESLADDPEFVAMFVEEARVVSYLQHPNIVQTHDFGIDDQGGYYLVMEWIEGLDLHAWCGAHRDTGRHTPWPVVTAIGIEVLKALSAAHERVDASGHLAPIFHRDVSPGNILIGVNGIVKLADFGLARAMDRARMTRPDIVKGKLSYLAPELSYGHEATVQSDIYGLGVVLWEALAGQKLIKDQDALEIVRRVREEAAPPLRSIRPDIPEELARAVHVCLEKEPSHRFHSAAEMVRTLANLLRQVPHPTDSDVISRSVLNARVWAASPTTGPGGQAHQQWTHGPMGYGAGHHPYPPTEYGPSDFGPPLSPQHPHHGGGGQGASGPSGGGPNGGGPNGGGASAHLAQGPAGHATEHRAYSGERRTLSASEDAQTYAQGGFDGPHPGRRK